MMIVCLVGMVNTLGAQPRLRLAVRSLPSPRQLDAIPAPERKIRVAAL